MTKVVSEKSSEVEKEREGYWKTLIPHTNLLLDFSITRHVKIFRTFLNLQVH